MPKLLVQDDFVGGRMFRVILLIGLTLFPLVAQTTGQRVVKSLEEQQIGNRTFTSKIEIVSFENASSQPLSMRFSVFGKQVDADNSSIALVKDPPRDRGKIFLNMGGRYWTYFPNIQRAGTLSPLSVVVGDVSTGDLIAPPPLYLYNAEIVKEEGESVELTLTAKNRDAPYGKIIRYYKGLYMQRAILIARSGVVLKIVDYTDHFTGYDGIIYPGLLKVQNQVKKGSYSIIRFSELKSADVPASWFNPNNLSQVRE